MFVASALKHTFFLLPELRTILVSGHWLLSHITIIKAMTRSERGLLLLRSIINAYKEIG